MGSIPWFLFLLLHCWCIGMVGMKAGAATVENSMEFPQKTKNRTTLWPSNCTTRHLSTGYRCAVSKGHMHPHVYGSTVNNSQSMERAQVSINGEWIKKMWCINTMEYYSVIKKNEILPFATTWMEREGIMLSEISQSEKDKNPMTSLIWGLEETKQMNTKEGEQK